MNLRSKRALVMGLGVHGGGLGVARFLVQHGADVTVTDLRSPEALQSSLHALRDLPIRYRLGEHRDEDFQSVEIVVQNPAVPRSSRYLQLARDAGAAVETEMTLFFRLCPGPILGVTGTKGKTTTTTLAAAMVREQFPDTVVAGNLRVSALEQLAHIGPNTPVVLELSSFALEGLGEANLSPRYACVTNISPDHLDRYTSIEAYAEAKRQIFLYQSDKGVVVLNARDRTVASWAADAPGRVVWFDEQRDQLHTDERATLFYGDRGLLWNEPSTHVAGDRPIYLEQIAQPGDVRLPGAHNLANVAAAAALAKAFGITSENIRRAIQSFRGVEHRLELVRELDGVRYINDTAATVPEAAIAALRSFDAPIVLIAGGADKRLTFDAFAQTITGRTKAVVLLDGTATPKLHAALDAASGAAGSQLTVVGPLNNFEAAVRTARDLAAQGDIVLLSPGCASFGMFRNEFHRGEEFRRIVAELESRTEKSRTEN